MTSFSILIICGIFFAFFVSQITAGGSNYDTAEEGEDDDLPPPLEDIPDEEQTLNGAEGRIMQGPDGKTHKTKGKGFLWVIEYDHWVTFYKDETSEQNVKIYDVAKSSITGYRQEGSTVYFNCGGKEECYIQLKTDRDVSKFISYLPPPQVASTSVYSEESNYSIEPWKLNPQTNPYYPNMPPDNFDPNNPYGYPGY